MALDISCMAACLQWSYCSRELVFGDVDHLVHRGGVGERHVPRAYTCWTYGFMHAWTADDGYPNPRPSPKVMAKMTTARAIDRKYSPCIRPEQNTDKQ